MDCQNVGPSVHADEGELLALVKRSSLAVDEGLQSTHQVLPNDLLLFPCDFTANGVKHRWDVDKLS